MSSIRLALPFLFSLCALVQAAEGLDSLVSLPGGCFLMGQRDGNTDERPLHQVCLPAFRMERHEVTQGDYKKIMHHNPSAFAWCGDSCPVESVDWEDAVTYCSRLGRFLPTEAEWEYAARALSGGEWPCEARDSCLQSMAWFKDNSGGHTHPVMGKQPNYWGLSDMGGNVWEWTADWYGAGFYAASPRQNPQGPEKGQGRVIRGGGWNYQAQGLRLAYRLPALPAQRAPMVGFRCVERR